MQEREPSAGDVAGAIVAVIILVITAYSIIDTIWGSKDVLDALSRLMDHCMSYRPDGSCAMSGF